MNICVRSDSCNKAGAVNVGDIQLKRVAKDARERKSHDIARGVRPPPMLSVRFNASNSF